MKPQSVLRSFLAASGSLLAVSSLHAATFYWDMDAGNPGFGGAAGGTWAQNSTTTGRWTTSSTGSIAGSLTQTTTNADAFNFGSATDALGAGTITVSGSVTMGNTAFASTSGAIVLTGGTINYAASPTITVSNASDTINSVVGATLTGTLSKSGPGILIFGGTNTYTGATAVNNGTLRAGAAAGGQAFGVNSAVTLANTATVTLDLNGFSQTIGSLAGGGATGGNVTLGTGSAVLTVGGNNTSTSFAGIISGTGTSGLTKNGTGTLTLTGANTYAGATTINAGTLNLGGGTANGSLASSTLTLANGSFSYTRTGTNTQDFTTTNFNSSGSTFSVSAGNTLNLGTVTRATGATTNFANAGAGTIAAALASNTNGIMAGFTHGDSWGVANGTGVAISALGFYTLSSVAGTTATNYDNNNIDVDNSAGALDASITANSLRFSSASANTLTLTGTTNVITSGGILVGSGVGGNLSTITGGTLAGANTKDLVVIQNNTSGGLTISSVIGNNTGATALGKAGAGLLTLAGSNTFTGGVLVNAGNITLANAGALNSSTPNNVTFGPGSTGTLSLGGNNLTIPVLNTNTAAPGSALIENASGTNATLTVNSASNSTFAGIIRDGTGGGTLALTKSGSGTLTLSGANTYNGGTTLSAGTLALSNASSLGANNVSITGSSRINATGGNGVGLTYANAINVGAALQLQNPQGATGSTATFSGQLTGSSAITIVNGGANAVLAGIAFTNINNTFTGNVIMPSGSVTGDDRFSFNSLGDGGNLTIQKAGHQNAFIHTGGTNIIFDTRQITIGTGFGGGLVDGGGVTPINRFMNNGSGTVTFNSNMGVTTIASAGTFFFDGSNTGDNTFAGTIANPTSGGNLGIGKNGAGKWILTGANGFDGETVIHEGTLSVNSVAALSSTNQPLGNNTVVQLGFRNNTGATLEFTVSSNSTTDKQIRLGNTLAAGTGGGRILSNGTGSLVFTNATFNPTITGITATRTLTLGGTNTGANEIQGVIQDNVASTGKVALAKVGAGTWTLSGTNTYTGGTTIGDNTQNVGTLNITNGSALGTGAVTIVSNTGSGNLSALTLNSNTGITVANVFTTSGTGQGNNGVIRNVTGSNVISGNINLTGGGGDTRIQSDGGSLTLSGTIAPNTTGRVLRLSGSSTGLISGNINNGSGANTLGGLIKEGVGTWTLSGTNNYTGATTVSAGTLVLASGASIANSTSLSLGATGTLDTSALALTPTGPSQPITISIDPTGTGTSGKLIASALNITNGVVTLSPTATLDDPVYILATYTSLTGAAFSSVTGLPSGYSLNYTYEGNKIALVQSTSGYSAWQSANSTSQTIDQDHDGDGVSNGVEFFIYGPVANSGFTALPGVDKALDGTLSVTWIKAAGYTGTYGVAPTGHFVVETSATLAGPWTPESSPGTVSITGNNVKYTFPGGPAYSGKNFARLKVTGP